MPITGERVGTERGWCPGRQGRGCETPDCDDEAVPMLGEEALASGGDEMSRRRARLLQLTSDGSGTARTHAEDARGDRTGKRATTTHEESNPGER